ncbi:hypothetical protein FOZ63_017299 [Perkinsus olseni]|uniref:PDEase domain-containing protein n=1 Tax=Perkinsus olseni TaxID=32597 RepID=A0A7J6R1N2_PEROL|nr:hypothetical protein FOZ63_017299 [Perkinsus olseni]
MSLTTTTTTQENDKNDKNDQAEDNVVTKSPLACAATASTLDYCEDDDASDDAPTISPFIQVARPESVVTSPSSVTHRHHHHHGSPSDAAGTPTSPSTAEVVAACAAAAAEESPNGHKVCAKDVLAYFRRFDLENFLTMMLIELGIHTPCNPAEFMCDYIRENLTERRSQYYDTANDSDEDDDDAYIYFPELKRGTKGRRASRRRSIQAGEVMHRADEEEECDSVPPPPQLTVARHVSHRWSHDLTSTAIRSIILRRVSRQLQNENPSVYAFVQQWMRDGMGGARDSTSTGRGSVSDTSRRASDSVAYDEAKFTAKILELPVMESLQLPDLLSWDLKLFNIDHAEMVRRAYSVFDRWGFVGEGKLVEASKLWGFINLISTDYHADNPYHNFYHAYQVMSCTVISVILATDMKVHFDITIKLQELLLDYNGSNEERHGQAGEWVDGALAESRPTLLQGIVHAADISNPLMPYDEYYNWSYRVVSEYYRQAEAERMEGLPFAPFMAHRPDDTLELAKLQVGFISFVVSPLWNTLDGLLNGIHERVEVMDDNFQRMKEVEDREQRQRTSSVSVAELAVTPRGPRSDRDEEEEKHAAAAAQWEH